MFILRRISEKGECNTSLGNDYKFTHNVHQPEEFNKLNQILDPEGMPNLCAYIHSENGAAYRVFTDQSTFIMTESGKTFARIS